MSSQLHPTSRFLAAMLALLLSFLCIAVKTSNGDIALKLAENDITLLLNESKDVSITFDAPEGAFGNVTFYSTLAKISSLQNGTTVVSNTALLPTVSGSNLGHETITFTVSPVGTEVFEPVTAYLRVTIQNSEEWHIFAEVVGWIYFIAWSVSFYPQIYDNWRRKSVIGLNFDFLALNILGFILYSIFNATLAWNDEVRAEYLDEHPGGLIPVMVNDIVFSFHAVFAVVVTIIQCYIYERGVQTVSLVAKLLIGVFLLFLVVSLICSAAEALSWLQFVNFCSYVKLAITLIKYIPQAWMNFRRKSTVGWSIGNVLLDFTGGILSMLQMIVNAWNYDDWTSIFGDPTKFGLGLFSVIFDILFLVQHYILYRRNMHDSSIVNSRSDLVT